MDVVGVVAGAGAAADVVEQGAQGGLLVEGGPGPGVEAGVPGAQGVGGLLVLLLGGGLPVLQAQPGAVEGLAVGEQAAGEGAQVGEVVVAVDGFGGAAGGEQGLDAVEQGADGGEGVIGGGRQASLRGRPGRGGRLAGLQQADGGGVVELRLRAS
ncbi:MAG: hypothetical protein R3F60_25765 [bacterium]